MHDCSSRSEVNKSVADRSGSRANSSEKYIYIYIDEGVRPVAWQQCKHCLYDVRQREGCQAATGWKTGQRQFAVAMQLVKTIKEYRCLTMAHSHVYSLRRA